MAFRKLGKAQVTNILEDVMGSSSSSSSNRDVSRFDDIAAVNVLIFAATNNIVHFDGVYFLIKREPAPFIASSSSSSAVHLRIDDDDEKNLQKSKWEEWTRKADRVTMKQNPGKIIQVQLVKNNASNL